MYIYIYRNFCFVLFCFQPYDELLNGWWEVWESWEEESGLTRERKCEAVRKLEYSGGWISQELTFCDELNSSNIGLVEFVYSKLYNRTILKVW